MKEIILSEHIESLLLLLQKFSDCLENFGFENGDIGNQRNIKYLTINGDFIENYTLYEGSSSILLNLGQVLPSRLEYLCLALSFITKIHYIMKKERIKYLAILESDSNGDLEINERIKNEKDEQVKILTKNVNELKKCKENSTTASSKNIATAQNKKEIKKIVKVTRTKWTISTVEVALPTSDEDCKKEVTPESHEIWCFMTYQSYWKDDKNTRCWRIIRRIKKSWEIIVKRQDDLYDKDGKFKKRLYRKTARMDADDIMDTGESSEQYGSNVAKNFTNVELPESSNNSNNQQTNVGLDTSDMDIDISKKRAADTQISRDYDGSEGSKRN
ncbi:hypothetical protein C1646_750723 [Rhizophagus diaphanus]|nr:hypothetical protein C1646_750723 [Rhizophagus diaphanus] [Rhizophagus sp. MUCL 43196]